MDPMSFSEKILHFLLPRPSNNHRAKALHVSSLSIYIVALVVFQLFLTTIHYFEPQVLGYATNITVSDLLKDTNDARAKNNVGPLNLDTQLSSAAAAKGNDMFVHQYWAHISPLGVDPWFWITSAGYNYSFAGENLARDFGDSQSVVDAWMNSPSHRENLLNDRYLDVGFAIVNGKYGNDETTLVVQTFGRRSGAQPSVESPASQSGSPSSFQQTSPPMKTSSNNNLPTGEILSIKNNDFVQPKINILTITKIVSIILAVALIILLATDALVIYKKKVVRISGHNLSHIIFLIAALIAINLIGRGLVL